MKDDHKHHKEDHKKDQSPDNGKVPFPEKQAEKKEGGELEKEKTKAAKQAAPIKNAKKK